MEIKKKKITFKQLIVRIRCGYARWVWSNIEPSATFEARRRTTVKMKDVEYPDNWQEPVLLRKGNQLSVDITLELSDGTKHLCLLVPIDGKPIKVG